MVYARILIPFVATSDRFGQWNPRAESWDVRFTRDILKDVPGSGFYDVLTGQNALEFGMKLALVFAEVAIGERSGLLSDTSRSEGLAGLGSGVGMYALLM